MKTNPISPIAPEITLETLPIPVMIAKPASVNLPTRAQWIRFQLKASRRPETISGMTAPTQVNLNVHAAIGAYVERAVYRWIAEARLNQVLFCT